MMKRFLAAAFLCATTGSAIAVELPPEIAKQGSIRVAIVPNYPPMEFRDPATDVLTGFDVELGEALAHLRIVHHLLDRLGELRLDGVRHPLRAEDRVPEREIDIGGLDARLGERRHVGQRRRTLLARHRQRLELARLRHAGGDLD